MGYQGSGPVHGCSGVKQGLAVGRYGASFCTHAWGSWVELRQGVSGLTISEVLTVA